MLQFTGSLLQNSELDELRRRLMNYIVKFLKNQDGVTAIEYALLATLIALVIIGAVTNLGTKLASLYSEVVAAMP